MFSLKGKSAVVTGGATGIGFEIAKIFAKQGAEVWIFDLNLNAASEAVKKINISLNQGCAHAIECNVTDPSSVKSAFKASTAKGKRLDILVNNAGVGFVGDILKTELSDFRRVMSVNVEGLFLCSKEAVRLMEKDGRGGVILNLGSCASVRPMKDRLAYATSKGAVLLMTTSLATDHLAEGIRVNCICPGRIHTTFVDNFVKKNWPGDEERQFKRLSEYMPMGRMGRPGEIAALALYLCSDEARFITGAAIPIDGGIMGADHPKLYNLEATVHPSLRSVL